MKIISQMPRKVSIISMLCMVLFSCSIWSMDKKNEDVDLSKYIIAVGTYNDITVWNLESKLLQTIWTSKSEPLQLFNTDTMIDGTLSFCPLARHIAGAFHENRKDDEGYGIDDYVIKVFDESGKVFKRFMLSSNKQAIPASFDSSGGMLMMGSLDLPPVIHMKFFRIGEKSYIIASVDTIIKVFSLEKGLLYSFDNEKYVRGLAVVKTKDGIIVAAAGEDGVRVYTIGGSRAKEIIRLKHREVKAVDISLDGKYIVSGGGKMVKVWDLKKGRLIHTYTTSANVLSIAYSPVPDQLGDFFVAGLENGNVGVFWVSKPYSHEILQVYEAEISFVLCTPDGKYIVVGSEYGDAIVVIKNKKDIIKQFNISKIRSLAIKPFVKKEEKEKDPDLQERVGYLRDQLEILGELQKEREEILQALEALQGDRKKVSFQQYQKKLQDQEVERKLQELEQRARRWKEKFREESVFYREKKK